MILFLPICLTFVISFDAGVVLSHEKSFKVRRDNQEWSARFPVAPSNDGKYHFKNIEPNNKMTIKNLTSYRPGNEESPITEVLPAEFPQLDLTEGILKNSSLKMGLDDILLSTFVTPIQFDVEGQNVPNVSETGPPPSTPTDFPSGKAIQFESDHSENHLQNKLSIPKNHFLNQTQRQVKIIFLRLPKPINDGSNPKTGKIDDVQGTQSSQLYPLISQLESPSEPPKAENPEKSNLSNHRGFPLNYFKKFMTSSFRPPSRNPGGPPLSSNKGNFSVLNYLPIQSYSDISPSRYSSEPTLNYSENSPPGFAGFAPVYPELPSPGFSKVSPSGYSRLSDYPGRPTFGSPNEEPPGYLGEPPLNYPTRNLPRYLSEPRLLSDNVESRQSGIELTKRTNPSLQGMNLDLRSKERQLLQELHQELNTPATNDDEYCENCIDIPHVGFPNGPFLGEVSIDFKHTLELIGTLKPYFHKFSMNFFTDFGKLPFILTFDTTSFRTSLLPRSVNHIQKLMPGPITITLEGNKNNGILLLINNKFLKSFSAKEIEIIRKSNYVYVTGDIDMIQIRYCGLN